MNKAEQFRLQIQKADEERKEAEVQAKIRAAEERAAQKVADLPLDIELVYFLIDRHQKLILQGKVKEAKLSLDKDSRCPYQEEVPEKIKYHRFNDDNLDEVVELLRKDGFQVSQKTWVPKWESHDVDYPASGGEYYSVEVSW